MQEETKWNWKKKKKKSQQQQQSNEKKNEKKSVSSTEIRRKSHINDKFCCAAFSQYWCLFLCVPPYGTACAWSDHTHGRNHMHNNFLVVSFAIAFLFLFYCFFFFIAGFIAEWINKWVEAKMCKNIWWQLEKWCRFCFVFPLDWEPREKITKIRGQTILIVWPTNACY